MDHENGGQSSVAPLCHLSSERLKEEWLWLQKPTIGLLAFLLSLVFSR